MTRTKKKSSAKTNTLDLHDDNLLSVNVRLSGTKSNVTQIDFRLCDDSTRKEKVLSFRGCANLRYVMDFDVVADNWFAQTKSFAQEVDQNTMRRFVQAQTAYWNIKYMPPFPKDKPIRKKLSALSSYRLFKIKFFGGLAEILAKRAVLQLGGNR